MRKVARIVLKAVSIKIFQKNYCAVNRLCYSLRPFHLKNERASKDREPITVLHSGDGNDGLPAPRVAPNWNH